MANYVRISYPLVQCTDNDGHPASGYEIHTYLAGTTTPTVSYNNRDCALGHENTNPVVLNARGEAEMYTQVALKLVFTIPGGDPSQPIWEIDYVGESREDLASGEATPVTTNNNYVVDPVPAVVALTNNLMLIMTPDLDNASTIVSNVFTGTGPDDCTAAGPYLGSTANSIFTVEIDYTDVSGDTFRWKKDGGAWTEDVPITASITQNLIEGVTVLFATNTGHVLGDTWAIEVMTPARVNLSGLGNLLVYKNKGGSVVALDGSDMKAGYPAQLILNQDLNGWLLMNPATPIFSTTTISAVRYRNIKSSDYTLQWTDQGVIIEFITASTLYLLPCSQFANRFFYVSNFSSGLVTVVADGAELVYGTGAGSGVSSFTIPYGTILQMETNGVDWEIATSNFNIPVGGIYQNTTGIAPGGTWGRPYPADLLLHFDGSGANFVDSSINNITLVAHGNATQSATQAKFGTTSMRVAGLGDYISLSGAYIQPGAYWQLDCWVYLDALGGTLVGWGDASNYLSLTAGNVSITLGGAYVAWTVGITTSVWTHLTVAANGFYTFCAKNGTWLTPQGFYPTTIVPGNLTVGSAVVAGMNGYIDEFRWTSTPEPIVNFTPKTAAYKTVWPWYRVS